MVTINLLPKKKKVRGGVLLLSATGLLWLIGAAWMGFAYYADQATVERLQQEIAQQKQMVQAAEKRIGLKANTATLQDYVELSEKMQHLFYPTTLLLDNFSENLPEMGKLLKISYALDGTVQLTGRFEQYDDVAAYLHNLLASPYVLEAQIKTIASVPVKWTGPVDEKGRPLSEALSAVGGDILPRYTATFEVKVLTLDLGVLNKQLAARTQEQKK